MKPLLLSFALCAAFAARAQSVAYPDSWSHPGLPAATLTRTSADTAALLAEDARPSARPATRPFRTGVLHTIDLDYSSAGARSVLPDGSIVWKQDLYLPGAGALALYGSALRLPPGARLFVGNPDHPETLVQVTGSAEGLWATPRIPGSHLSVELDLPAGCDPESAQFRIDELCQFYRGVMDHAPAAVAKSTAVYFPYNGSSPCEINAVCPQGSSFSDQRRATVHIEYKGQGYAYAGSGVMMNNTAGDCRPYLLTASHIDFTNSTSSSTFATWNFYFNYETPTCTYSGAQPSIAQVVTGAQFRARSSYDSSSDQLVGDFLLLELSRPVPAAYNAYLAGWDHSGVPAVSGTYISFHHPSGDVKKLSTATSASPLGDFNGGQPASHWQVSWSAGGIEGGSSGSGLFSPSGLHIGDLSGGGGTNSCATPNRSGEAMSQIAEYSKNSQNWEYTYQTPSSSATRLRDWLDPSNGTSNTLAGKNNSCAQTSAVNAVGVSRLRLYPVPAREVLYVELPARSDVAVQDLTGRTLMMREQVSGTIALPLSGLAPGAYLVRVSNEGGTEVRKILVQ